jgi:hypothetical protein
MSTPAIIYIVWLALCMCAKLSMHGKPIVGKHDFRWSLFINSLLCALLYWGGFFAKVAP